MSIFSSSQPMTDEELAFVQYRVSRFGLFTGGAFFAFFAYRIVLEIFLEHGTKLSDFSFLFHFLGSASFFAVWLLTFRGKCSERYIRWVETLGLLCGAWSMMVMGQYIPLWAQPQYIVLLAVTYAVVLRAIYVPSTALRTLVLGLWVGLEMVCTMYWIYLRIDLDKWRLIDPMFLKMEPGHVAANVALNAGAWWALTLFTATAASRVIYGLRRDVHDAKQLGQYQLEHKLGEGGMGVVYRASHVLLRRPTAVKLLHPEKAGPTNIVRFEREVRLMAKLRHPNTVTVFDYGHTPDGMFYYAMELIDGATLSRIVDKTGPQDHGRVLHIIEQVASALVEAHGVGLIHRDIKPANIMVHLPHKHGGIHENAKVLDFGLVKESRSQDVELTQANTLTGTPQYMSPEAIENPETVDARSDLYSLGCVAYYLLTGKHVFEGNSVMDICAKHLKETPVTLSQRLGRDLPSHLESAIMQCLEKDPKARPQNARELQHTLQTCQSVASFSAHDAQEWWEEYGILFIPSEDEVTSSRGFLAIDLSRASTPVST